MQRCQSPADASLRVRSASSRAACWQSAHDWARYAPRRLIGDIQFVSDAAQCALAGQPAGTCGQPRCRHGGHRMISLASQPAARTSCHHPVRAAVRRGQHSWHALTTKGLLPIAATVRPAPLQKAAATWRSRVRRCRTALEVWIPPSTIQRLFVGIALTSLLCSPIAGKAGSCNPVLQA